MANLELLLHQYGTVKSLAMAIDRAPAVVSQMRTGRSFGVRIARHVEGAPGLPEGFLDTYNHGSVPPYEALLAQLHAILKSGEISTEEKSLLRYYRKLSRTKKKVLLSLAEEMSDGTS